MDLWMLVLLVPVALLASSFARGYRSPKRLREIAGVIAKGAPVIDVRTPAEFAQGHYRRARNIPVDALSSRLDELGPAGEPVVLYCRSGSRSGRALRTLQTHGFTSLYDLGPMRNTDKLPPLTRVELADAAPPPTRNQRKRQRRRDTRGA